MGIVLGSIVGGGIRIKDRNSNRRKPSKRTEVGIRTER